MTEAQFKKLLELYGNSIFGFCCHLTEDINIAEDLYHDSVLKAMSLLAKMKCDDYSENELKTARNYIIGIAVRLNKNRKRRKHASHSLDDEKLSAVICSGCDVAAEAEQKEVFNTIRAIIAQLPEKLCTVTYMFYFADMKLEEIAKQLHIPTGTVKSRLNRARKAIKAELEEKGYEKY